MSKAMPQTPIQLDKTFWVVLAGLSLLWGSSFTANHTVLQELGAHTVVALRSIIAMVLIWGLVIWRRLPLPKSLRLWALSGLLGVMSLYLPNILVIWGQQYVPSGLAGILNASSSIFTMFFASFMLADEGLTRGKVIGGVLGFAGLIVALGIDNLVAFDPMSLGQLSIVLSACIFGASAVLVRRYLGGIRPEVTVAIMMTATTALSLPMAIHFEGMLTLDYRATSWLSILYLAGFSGFFAYIIMYRYLPIYGAGNLNLYCLLTGPIAIALGAIFYNERLSSNSYLGFGLIALGLIFVDGRFFSVTRSKETTDA